MTICTRYINTPSVDENELEAAASELSDLLMGGSAFQINGADPRTVLEVANRRGPDIIRSLTRLNNELRRRDQIRKSRNSD